MVARACACPNVVWVRLHSVSTGLKSFPMTPGCSLAAANLDQFQCDARPSLLPCRPSPLFVQGPLTRRGLAGLAGLSGVTKTRNGDPKAQIRSSDLLAPPFSLLCLSFLSPVSRLSVVRSRSRFAMSCTLWFSSTARSLVNPSILHTFMYTCMHTCLHDTHACFCQPTFHVHPGCGATACDRLGWLSARQFSPPPCARSWQWSWRSCWHKHTRKYPKLARYSSVLCARGLWYGQGT